MLSYRYVYLFLPGLEVLLLLKVKYQIKLQTDKARPKQNYIWKWQVILS